MMLVDVMVVVAGQSSDPESTGAAEGSGEASASEELRILIGTPVLKGIPVPVPIGP